MFEQLRNASSEKDIEKIYHETLTYCLSEEGARVEQIKSIRGTDGIVDGEFLLDGKSHVFRIIVETKNKESFHQPSVRAKALIQVLYYMHDFEENGIEIPNIILVGDRDECFLVHTNLVQKHLTLNTDWSGAPSQAYKNNFTLLKELTNDNLLQGGCYVHNITEEFSFFDVVDEIKAMTQDIKYEVRLTQKNIRKVFDYFTLNVLKRKTSGESVYSPREQVEYFMELVLDSDDVFIHPKKKGKAKFKGVDIDVHVENFLAFTGRYTFNFNAEEKKRFTEICDQLIEESDRRFHGDFYTPTIWVDEAHKMLNENLGYDWKEQYMVWDCAAGTHNLTRDYKFFDLYASSLHQHDLEIGRKFNQEAEAKFQYDFLNDDVDTFDILRQQVKMGYVLSERDFYGTKIWEKAPSLIRGLLKGKKLLFFINPPYGTSTNRGETHKGGMSETAINKLMLKNNIGASAQQLYAQFLYRIQELNNVFNSDIVIGLFSPTIWLTGGMAKGLRREFLNEFQYKTGMLFQASHFADVKSNWGIAFTLFKSGGVNDSSFNLELKNLSENGIIHVGHKTLYNLDDSVSLSTWLRDEVKKLKTFDSPQMRGALNWNPNPNRGRLTENALGYLVVGGNNTYQNNQMVILLSSCYNTANGISVMEENYKKCFSAFTARRLITGGIVNWTNDKDEYMLPSTLHPLYRQWENDSIIYGLFNTASNQSALRGIDYNKDSWNILNHFFFMSKQEMKDLSLGQHHNDEVYEDLQNHAEDERFVYKKLQEVQLSPDAQAVLDKARQLVKDSFQYREIFNQEHPEYHINTWDAGWYQIKGLLKEYMPEQLKEFNQLYKQFEDRMRPLVVELGFLYDYPGYEPKE